MEDFSIKLSNGKYTVFYDGQTTYFDSIFDALNWIQKFQAFLDASFYQDCIDDASNDCVYM